MKNEKEYGEYRYFGSVRIQVYGKKIPDDEIKMYIDRGKKLYPDLFKSLVLYVHKDSVTVEYVLHTPVEKFCRTTGEQMALC